MLNVQKRLVTGALAAMVFGVCAGANAAEILVFNFTDQDAVADVVAAGLTSTDFTNGGGLTHVSFDSGAAASRGFNPGDDAAEAEANGAFWTFTLSAQSGYAFDVTSLSLGEWREANGPTEFQVWADGSLIGFRRIDELRLPCSRDCGAGVRHHRAGGSHPGVGCVEQRRQRRLVRGQRGRQRQRHAAGHERSRAGEPAAVRHRTPAGRAPRPRPRVAFQAHSSTCAAR